MEIFPSDPAHSLATVGLCEGHANTPARFAIIDSETNGLSAASRIVEFACVVVSESFEILESFETVINPGSQVRGTRIHGLRQSDLIGAPDFRDVASDIAGLIEGRIVVGHHLAFDWSVLRSEFRRLGASVRSDARGVCTASLARATLGSPASLTSVCRRLGIPADKLHTAMGDVLATLRVLEELANRLGDQPMTQPVSRVAKGWKLQAAVRPVPRAEAMYR